MSTGAPPAEESPEIAAARQARQAQAVRAAAGESLPAIPPPAIRDPLPYCVRATVALLASVLAPPLVTALALAAAVTPFHTASIAGSLAAALAAVLAIFGGAGFWAYARAWRAGLRRSDCILRDPRLVMLYLGLLAAYGVATITGWLWYLAVGLQRW